MHATMLALPSAAQRAVRPAFKSNPPSRLAGINRIKPCQAVSVSGAELIEDIKRLKAENEALRAELAKVQGVPPTAVRIGGVANGTAAVATTAVQEGSLKPGALEEGIVWPKRGEEFWKRPARSTPLSLSPAVPPPPVERDPEALHIVHITAEMAPIAKVGGLGDVVTGLAKACLARGHHVAVMLPFYQCLPEDQIEGLKHEMDIMVPKGRVWDGEMQVGHLKTSVFWGRIAGCPTYLIRPADPKECNVFQGGRIYGGSYNELEAYLYFSRACLEFLKQSGQQPHVLHLHEWQACAAALLYWEVYHDEGLFRPRVVMTIHNMDNTGECRQDEFSYTGYPGELLATPDKALDERTIGHNPERLSLMKGGIIYSNAVTTVSPSYAREILDGGAAGWMRSVINTPEIREKISGVLNGIDAEAWDPATDPLLPAPFTSTAPEGKALCKKFLQKGLGLEEDPNKPLVVVVSRLVPQKGIQLMLGAMHRTLEQGGQFVLLGSGHSDGTFKSLAAGEFKDHPQVRLLVMYSENLSHLLYAAADIVLVPSMFEPCGLTQMIALRYGAVPVVRRTGGLADTVRDVDNHPVPAEANGYTFDGQDLSSCNSTLDRAIKAYKERPESWRELILRNMREDVAWNRRAKEYVNLYTEISRQ